jgi:hypothetical protein
MWDVRIRIRIGMRDEGWRGAANHRTRHVCTEGCMYVLDVQKYCMSLKSFHQRAGCGGRLQSTAPHIIGDLSPKEE